MNEGLDQKSWRIWRSRTGDRDLISDLNVEWALYGLCADSDLLQI